MDVYGYCLDDPINFYDRTGLASLVAGPAPFPIFSPVFIPGTPENDAFVKGTIKGFRGLRESILENDDEDETQ